MQETRSLNQFSSDIIQPAESEILPVVSGANFVDASDELKILTNIYLHKNN